MDRNARNASRGYTAGTRKAKAMRMQTVLVRIPREWLGRFNLLISGFQVRVLGGSPLSHRHLASARVIRLSCYRSERRKGLRLWVLLLPTLRVSACEKEN